jgi:hypothetical protein
MTGTSALGLDISAALQHFRARWKQINSIMSRRFGTSRDGL